LRNRGYIIGLLFSLSVLGGCTTVEYAPVEEVFVPAKGVYHKIGKGETLWRIAKTYNVDINKIIKSNNIPSVAHLEVNQLVFIPGAERILNVEVEDEQLDEKEFVWPLKGNVVNYFGERIRNQLNKGIGIKADTGESVKAARSGSVVFADYLGGYGYTVIIDHGDGFQTVYSQNASLQVKVGDRVTRGSEIGRVGVRDELSYLHFEIRKHSVADNPMYYLP